MANKKITDFTTLTSGGVDRATDVLEISDVSASQGKKITPNALMGISGAAVGDTDSQTLSNKTITAPTISSPVLSGTVTGTYTLGGTPTFPAAVVTLTGSQTLTNKILTSPTINTATIVNPTLTIDTVTGFSVSNTGTVFGLAVTTGTIGTAGIANSAVDYTKVATGFAVQIVSTNYSAVATGTTLLPYDDTIPQITEGDEYMTQAITPKSATNHLSIEVTFFGAVSAAQDFTLALFQDAIVNALAANAVLQLTTHGEVNPKLTFDMAAGTTSSTTFRVRAGGNNAGTTTFNGAASARKYGAIPKSNIKITEYKA